MSGLQEKGKSGFARNANQPIGIEKKCTRCQKNKTLDEFNLHLNGKYGKRAYCKSCQSKSSKAWRINNLEKCRTKDRERLLKNIEKERERKRKIARKWYENNKDIGKIRVLQWQKENPEKVRNHRKKSYIKRFINPGNKLSHNVSVAIRKSLKSNKVGRHWEKLVDYTMHDLKKHIEKQFSDGMTWLNYGLNGWEIDHIIPQSVFNFNKAEDIDFKKCWALKNLRPLWADDNRQKQNKLDKPFQPSFSFGHRMADVA